MAKHKRLKPIGDYLYDKGEMIEQMFSSIPIVEIRNMVPIKLQGMPLHELKAECLVELLGISDRDIINILNGKKERGLSSSDSEHEGVLVISDDERRIKKEKKDTARKIKTERVSSKRDSDKRTSLEPSISKKKRKSKEEVDTKSKKKKKKSEDKKSMSEIPSCSREVAKVPVGKKKKDDKKKGTSKMKEDEVVVLDDDSDKEEKREQKSLLDLLELEMRARAIRSLLEKEDRSHSQKILSEYKDEPDDLIPVEIEPPQIELLSDSDEDVEIDANSKGKKCIDNSNDCNTSQENVYNPQDQENDSRSPLVGLNNDSNSSWCNAPGTQTSTSTNKMQYTSENDSTTVPDNDAHESCKKVSAQDDDCTHVVSVQEDNSYKCGGSDNLKPTSEQSDESIVIAEETVSKNEEIKITTGHFLVYEEPSVVLAIDGSQIEENGANRIQHACQSVTAHKTDSKDESNALAELDQYSCVPEMEHSQINHMGEISNNNDSVELAAAKPLVLLPEGEENCVTNLSKSSLNSPEPSMQDVSVGISMERNVKDDSHLPFDNDALDYDYNPATTYSEKKSELVSCQPLSKDICSVDEEMSSGVTSVDNREQVPNKLGEKSGSSLTEKYCVESESKSNQTPSSPERCLETQNISVELDSVSSEPLLEISTDNHSIEDDAEANCVLQDSSNSEYYKNQPRVCPEDVIVSSSGLQVSMNPESSLVVCESGVVHKHEITLPNEEACSSQDFIFSDAKNVVGEEKDVPKEEADNPQLLPTQPQGTSMTESYLVSLTSDSKAENGNKSAQYNELIVEQTFHHTGEAESLACSLCDDTSSRRLDSTLPVNEQITESYNTLNDKKNLPKSSSVLSYENVVACEYTVSGDSLVINFSAAPNESRPILDEASTRIHPPLSPEPEIVGENRGNACEAARLSMQSDESPRGPITKDVTEVIDITKGELVDGPDVVYISEERFDCESVDDSDNEVSGKTALILEQMNNILDNDVSVGVDGDNSEQSESSSSEFPAEILSVDSENSDSEYNNETEDDGQGQKSSDNIVEILDDDDSDRKEPYLHSNNDTICGGEMIENSIEVVDDSSSCSSVYSVEFQKGNLKSDDPVMLVHPNDSKYNDCRVTQTENPKSSNDLVALEIDGSESDDCAIVFPSTGASADDGTVLENPEIPEAGKCCLIPVQTVSTTDKKGVVVTILIEDDGEEETKLLTETVPAEIFDLEDDDELKTNWTARWLESDNVKKVVKTSKIWANVRKQMKIKLKKSNTPAVSDDLNPPEDRGPPSLIGSVEEYHRLVKEGVICSKATQNDDQTCDLNSTARMNEDIPKEDLDRNNTLRNTASRESGSRSEPTSIGSMSDRSKVHKERKKKSGRRKSDTHKKSDKSDRRKKPKNYVVMPCPSKLSSKQSINSMDLPRGNEESILDKKVTESKVPLEEGEIIELPITKEADCVRKKTVESSQQIRDGKICMVGGKSVVESVEGREEGETNEKEEGEISTDDDDVDDSKSQSICQVKPCPSQKISTERKVCNRMDPPLPLKPPVKSKPLPAKPPERNGAAKRFILRNLQLGKKNTVASKNKKKRKKGGVGNKRASFKPAPEKGLPDSLPKVMIPYDSQNLNQMSVAMSKSSLQTTPGIQAPYLSAYPGLPQPECNSSLIGQVQNTSIVNNTPQYDSYYSWAYSQGLINTASGNYGYGTPETTPDPNIYKQWEEYYRKLMEACKISAAHASASTVVGETEKSGYTWVFDHSATVSQSAPVQALADSTADPGKQVQPDETLPEQGEQGEQGAVNPSPVPVNKMTEKDRFESWQFRFGLKGLLKEHFIPPPNSGGNKQT